MGYQAGMNERDPVDEDARREADAAAAEAGSIGESEGWEQAEEELRERAEHGDAAPADES
jgi:hypothetical protein